MQDQTGRRATAEKIGTENGLAPCALLLMFGRTVGLSLSIRSIPPAEQEMNLSANMIKAEGLFWGFQGGEATLAYLTLRSKGIVGYSVYIRNSVYKLLTGIEIDIIYLINIKRRVFANEKKSFAQG